jgi:hypothetical protein
MATSPDDRSISVHKDVKLKLIKLAKLQKRTQKGMVAWLVEKEEQRTPSLFKNKE